ncbi:MgtC/SapB family protein [Caminibacter mediatlanticus]|uniref:DUF4010 domain-containing protein n=1 Tax=Caminibacter mediatlanticus TB-2 TaxID=391592 RepID=A0AAI9F2I6_9BACT|nr:DUF4010 domain-containing protein [Caminibacter mediatlanticus]EDM23853.1 hypothetical protein CMTB2_01259 [Caminibacter mediatlanticus TB-2]
MINSDLIHFLITSLFSFLIGLEIKSYTLSVKKEYPLIGSTRTYLFLGMIGFVSYKISIYFYIIFFFTFSILFALFYIQKLKEHKSSILLFLIASLVYTLGPISIIYPIWMIGIIFVIIVFALNYKKLLKNFAENINQEEFETLAKFVLLSLVILPLLPKKNIPFLDISYFKIWLVVVVVSSISYLSYIASKYIFKNKGYLLTGILGGLYSSTATTVVLAKKIDTQNIKIINSAIIIATAMMYIRLLIITFIFNQKVGMKLLFPFLILAFISTIISLFQYKKENNYPSITDNNPLELGTAFLFAFLFILMIAITKIVILHFGNLGLKVLSFIVGFTDIDPFILSLLTGKYHINETYIVSAIIIASGSNNILKGIYALIFSKNKAKFSSIVLFLLGIISIIYAIRS